MPKREEPEEVIEEPDPIDESAHKATIIFRLRSLSETYSSNDLSVSNLIYSFYWQGVGLGISNLSYKLESSGNNYALSGQTLDLSYTSGDSLSWSLDYGTVLSGKGIISSSSNKYETNTVKGSKFSALIGMGWDGRASRA